MKLAPWALALISLLAACSRREIESTSVTSPAILAERGADYVACRDALVAGPQEEFDSVIAGLRANSGSARGRALAEALVIRRTEHGKAVVFDGIVRAVHDGAGLAADGTPFPRFDNIVDTPRPELSPLALEHVLTRTDVDPSMRTAYINMVAFRSSEALSILEMADEWPWGVVKVAWNTIELIRVTGDQRVLDAYVNAFDRCRETTPEDWHTPDRTVYELSRLNTSAALDAARLMQSHERSRMARDGFAPWSDLGAWSHYAALRHADTRNKLDRRKPPDPQRDAAIAAAMSDANLRLARFIVWTRIEDTVAALESSGISTSPR